MASDLTSIPSVPAVYALMSGKDKKSYVYIGITENLKRRIHQHLVKIDSSVTAAGSVVKINTDKITEIRWWTDESFSQREYREAAEEIAFEIHNPILRSQGNTTEKCTSLLKNDGFRTEVEKKLKGAPSGVHSLMTMEDLVSRIEALEIEIQNIKRKLE